MLSERALKDLEGAIDLAVGLIKLLVAINGGAAVAILAFFGNLVASGSLNPSMVGPIVMALLMFGLGVLFAAVACFLAYLVEAERATDPNPGPSLLRSDLQYWALWSAALALASFLIGLVAAACALAAIYSARGGSSASVSIM